jgi:hypothetical protein
MNVLRFSICATSAAESAKGGTTSSAAAISAWRLLISKSSLGAEQVAYADCAAEMLAVTHQALA